MYILRNSLYGQFYVISESLFLKVCMEKDSRSRQQAWYDSDINVVTVVFNLSCNTSKHQLVSVLVPSP